VGWCGAPWCAAVCGLLAGGCGRGSAARRYKTVRRRAERYRHTHTHTQHTTQAPLLLLLLLPPLLVSPHRYRRTVLSASGLPPEDNAGGWSDDSETLSRTHSQKLSEYRRKYSDAMESRTSHTGAPPGRIASRADAGIQAHAHTRAHAHALVPPSLLASVRGRMAHRRHGTRA
jgi:hypothetical protein